MKLLRDRPAWIAAGVAVAVRLALMAAHPALFGGDSVVRLANADRVLLSYQLPALQAVIHVLWSMWPSQWAPRLFVALASGVAAAGFYRMGRQILPERAALLPSLLFALNPFLTAYSIVPYQEMLMLAGLCWAFAWAAEGREGPAACALAVACLTRYEAWLACPAVLWISWNGGAQTPLKRLRGAALYAAAPLAWMLWHGGLTPSGSFAIEGAVSVERLWRWVYLGWITLKYGWFVLPIAALGAWSFVRQRRWREPAWQALLLFGALFAVAILLSAHGERDQPERYVTAREAHLPIAFVCLLAGLGIHTLRRRRVEIGTAALTLSLLSAERFVAAETGEPHVALAYQAAQFLDERLGPSETAVVLAKPVPADMLERFLEMSERQGGPDARSEALRTLLELNAEPPDYQRILVQTRFGRNRVRSLASLPTSLVPTQPEPDATRPDWVLLWSDFEPSNSVEESLREELRKRQEVTRLVGGSDKWLLVLR